MFCCTDMIVCFRSACQRVKPLHSSTDLSDPCSLTRRSLRVQYHRNKYIKYDILAWLLPSRRVSSLSSLQFHTGFFDSEMSSCTCNFSERCWPGCTVPACKVICQVIDNNGVMMVVTPRSRLLYRFLCTHEKAMSKQLGVSRGQRELNWSASSVSTVASLVPSQAILSVVCVIYLPNMASCAMHETTHYMLHSTRSVMIH